MIRRLLILASVILPSYAFPAEINWPPKNPNELIGTIGCDYPERENIGNFTQVFNNAEFYLLYRKSGERNFVMLMKKRSNQWCDAEVVSAIEIPPITEKIRIPNQEYDKYAVSFSCRYFDVEWKSLEHAIGILDQTLPSGYFVPSSAWMVDTKNESLTPVDSDLVACARFSIHDSRGHPDA